MVDVTFATLHGPIFNYLVQPFWRDVSCCNLVAVMNLASVININFNLLTEVLCQQLQITWKAQRWDNTAIIYTN